MAKPIHSMIRVLDEARSLAFYRVALGLEIADRYPFDNFTLIYLRDPSSPFELELTVNHDRTEPYNSGDGYGHLAIAVDDLDAEHGKMEKAGATPGQIRELKRDGALLGRFFFVRDPDGCSIEVLQRGGRFGRTKPIKEERHKRDRPPRPIQPPRLPEDRRRPSRPRGRRGHQRHRRLGRRRQGHRPARHGHHGGGRPRHLPARPHRRHLLRPRHHALGRQGPGPASHGRRGRRPPGRRCRGAPRHPYLNVAWENDRVALLEDMACETNRITLDPKAKDKLGLPVASVHFDDHPNDIAMRAHAVQQGSAIYSAVGAPG